MTKNLELGQFGGKVSVNDSTEHISFGSTIDGPITISGDLNVTGIATASSFVGDLTGNVTGDVTGNTDTATTLVDGTYNLNTTGIITASSFDGNLTGNVTGNADTATTASGLTDGTYNLNTSGIITASSFVGDLSGNLSGNTNIFGNLTVTGDLTIDGTQTILNTQIVDIEDSTIGIASTSTASNTTADGAGIVVYGGSDGDKTLLWNTSKNSFEFNQNLTGIGATFTNNITITSSSDGKELLRFNTDRTWSFFQRNTGSITSLDFKSSTSGKYFTISNQDGATIAAFFSGLTADINQVSLVPLGGSVGVGTSTNLVSEFDILGKTLIGDLIDSANITNVVDTGSSTGIDAYRPINLVDTSGLIKIARGNDSFGPGLDIQSWSADLSTLRGRWLPSVDEYGFSFNVQYDGVTTQSNLFITPTGNLLVGESGTTVGSALSSTVDSFGRSNKLQVQGNTYISGNVGIGTTISASKLHIKGNDGILNLEGDDHVYIQFYPDGYATGRKAWFGFGNSGDNFLSIRNEFTDGSGHIALRPGSDANVLVNTNTPTGTANQKLQVDGGAYFANAVGVATTNPKSSLHVAGNSIFYDEIRLTYSSPWSYTQFGNDSSDTDARWRVSKFGTTTSTISQTEIYSDSFYVSGVVSLASTVSIGTTISLVPYNDLGTLSFEGSAGQLFSITNNLSSGSIFSVNDISGVPSIDIDADGTIQLGAYGGNIGIGTTSASSKLNIVGESNFAGNVSIAGSVHVGTDGGPSYFVAALNATSKKNNEEVIRISNVDGNSGTVKSSSSLGFSYARSSKYPSADIVFDQGAQSGFQGNLYFRVRPGGTASDVEPTPYMGIHQNGNVTIGTTSRTNLDNVKLAVQSVGVGSEAIRIGDGGNSGSVQGETYIGMTHYDVNVYEYPSAKIGVKEISLGSFDADILFCTRNSSSNIDPSVRMVLSSDGNLGINETNPDALLHVTGDSETARIVIQSTEIGRPTFDGSDGGLDLLADGVNATSKYTPSIKFGSTDPQLVTTNPKFGAAIIAEATNSYTDDTDGGMDLSFWTSPSNPGTGHGLQQRMVVDQNGNIGINTTNSTSKLKIYDGDLHFANGTLNDDTYQYIRFLEYKNADTSLQGMYARYDGNSNYLRIGSHDANTADLADDTDALIISRAYRNIGINTIPADTYKLKVFDDFDSTDSGTQEVLNVECFVHDVNTPTTIAFDLNMRLNGTDTATADRSFFGSRYSINSFATGGDTSDEHRVYGHYNNIDVYGDSDFIVGNYQDLDCRHTSGYVSNIWGSYNIVRPISSTGDIGNIYSCYNLAQPSLSSSSAIVNLMANNSRINIDTTSTNTVQNAFAYYASIDNDAGTNASMNIVAGLYVDYTTVSGMNYPYGIYIADTGPSNYFGGKVGIGLTIPTYKLDVNGSQIRVETGNGYVLIGPANTSFSHFTTDRNKYYFNQPIVVDDQLYSYNNDLILGTNNTSVEGIRIKDTTGYVLLGYTTSNGSYRLQVNSQIFATSATIATSDGRYKENVANIENGIDLVKKLNPVSFTWKPQEEISTIEYVETPILDDNANEVLDENGEVITEIIEKKKILRDKHEFPEGYHVGFIAQDVQEAFSDQPWIQNLVKTNTREKVLDEDGNLIAEEEEFLGIAEGNMIPILTSALKQCISRIEQLEEIVQQLTA